MKDKIDDTAMETPSLSLNFSAFIDKEVKVLKDESVIQGICRSIDGYLNTILENAIYTRKLDGKTIKMKSCFVTGGSVKNISSIN